MTHPVHVYLRGNPVPVEVHYTDEAAAVGTMAFLAEHLRKPPSKRPAWVVGRDAVVTRMNKDGVDNAEVKVPIAVFDLREVVGCQRFNPKRSDDAID